DGCLGQFDSQRIFPCSTKGSRYYADVAFQSGDVFLFGPETRGLPESLRSRYPATQCLKIPMLPESRSLNLSNAVSIFVYEAWRQQGFKGSI
ncbi:MAG: tRNA (uridine(34)/cytosine(34)/5-carboxymethylaminomethyluridine(34)-2'-O)-methyltransferase TrmL, partial [Gammaproteobacteria bacterium]|nr:tRNA (uridine(34)/cytosine(34)/5-carboxymethylaminomethyluridine(34)-2'-O)-methyltransferase TrmL [Gammaproteobacteria bacterium]